MSDKPTSPKAPKPEIQRAKRWNAVWVVPIVALLLGIWLLYRNFTAQGEVVHVRFETADGIEAGKTEVRCRSVKVGMVRHVKLADDLKSVMVDIDVDRDEENLLRKGTRFWVVRPRITGTELSGVSTLITGAYIELDPGPANAPRDESFKGLETPPATNRNVPGLRLTLVADQAGSLATGAPIYFRGFEVGRIEGRKLSEDGSQVSYDAFIGETYSGLVTENTRFWNTSGIDISAGADGFKLRTPSFQAMISGGVSFGVTHGEEPGAAATDGRSFTLYKDEEFAKKSSFDPTMRLLLLFDQTVRGLSERAPVEYRGITIGRVSRISFDLMPGAQNMSVPVLIEIDPRLMVPENPNKEKDADIAFIRQAVDKGLRGALKTGSLITGALFVDLDYYDDVLPQGMGKVGEFDTVPTVSSGLAQLEAKLSAVLDKFQALEIDKAVTGIGAAAKEIEATAAATRKSVSSLGPDGPMQGDMLRVLDELRASLRSLKSVTNTIEEKPNALLFGRESSNNPVPKKAER